MELTKQQNFSSLFFCPCFCMKDCAPNCFCSSWYIRDYHRIVASIAAGDNFRSCCSQLLAICIQKYASQRRGWTSAINASGIYASTLIDSEYFVSWTQAIKEPWRSYKKD